MSLSDACIQSHCCASTKVLFSFIKDVRQGSSEELHLVGLVLFSTGFCWNTAVWNCNHCRVINLGAWVDPQTFRFSVISSERQRPVEASEITKSVET